MKEDSLHPPRPPFPPVRTRPDQVSGNHISNFTVDVGEVVTEPITRQMGTELLKVGLEHVGSAEAGNVDPGVRLTASVMVTLGSPRAISDVQLVHAEARRTRRSRMSKGAVCRNMASGAMDGPSTSPPLGF